MLTAILDIEQLEQPQQPNNGCTLSRQSVYFNDIEINTTEDIEVWHQNKNLQ